MHQRIISISPFAGQFARRSLLGEYSFGLAHCCDDMDSVKARIKQEIQESMHASKQSAWTVNAVIVLVKVVHTVSPPRPFQRAGLQRPEVNCVSEPCTVLEEPLDGHNGMSEVVAWPHSHLKYFSRDLLP